jgi:hypothetical protein
VLCKSTNWEPGLMCISCVKRLSVLPAIKKHSNPGLQAIVALRLICWPLQNTDVSISIYNDGARLSITQYFHKMGGYWISLVSCNYHNQVSQTRSHALLNYRHGIDEVIW